MNGDSLDNSVQFTDLGRKCYTDVAPKWTLSPERQTVGHSRGLPTL